MISDEIHEKIKQAIREQTAVVYEEGGLPKAGDKFRSGEWDYKLSAQFDGGETALSAVLPMIVEKCAEVLDADAAERLRHFLSPGHDAT